MKKILVPTDFSQVADNALEHAIEIAAEFQSELFLYHVYHIHKIDYKLDLPEDEQPLKKQAERRMSLSELKYKKKISRKGISLHTIVENDHISSLFKRKTKEQGIDLIVMGSKGASGLKRVILGSTAVVALETSKVPVLVVPPEHSFRPLNHIVLATDHKEVSKSVLLPLQKLAHAFGARVTVLNVINSSNKKLIREQTLSLEGVETTYREVPMSKSINETINVFIEKEGCDLLCMIRREKGFIESVFKKSITRAQVFSNQILLLVLPEV